MNSQINEIANTFNIAHIDLWLIKSFSKVLSDCCINDYDIIDIC